MLMVLTSSLSGDTLQFVNRQFLQDGAYTSGENEQRDEWTPETEVGTISSGSYCYSLLSSVCRSCDTNEQEIFTFLHAVNETHCYFTFSNI